MTKQLSSRLTKQNSVTIIRAAKCKQRNGVWTILEEIGIALISGRMWEFTRLFFANYAQLARCGRSSQQKRSKCSVRTVVNSQILKLSTWLLAKNQGNLMTGSSGFGVSLLKLSLIPLPAWTIMFADKTSAVLT